jgi:hypothetical protein
MDETGGEEQIYGRQYSYLIMVIMISNSSGGVKFSPSYVNALRTQLYAWSNTSGYQIEGLQP